MQEFEMIEETRLFLATYLTSTFLLIKKVKLPLSKLRLGRLEVVLSRFSSGLFRAMFAMKERTNGKEILR